jgi:hypothetical protein
MMHHGYGQGKSYTVALLYLEPLAGQADREKAKEYRPKLRVVA